MPANVEIKARIRSVDALLPLARALSDDAHLPLIHQDDTFFRVGDGRLKLRVFGDGSGELIHYRRADTPGAKVSDYLISPVPEPDGLREVLARGLGVIGRVRKHRILLLVGHTRVHLDTVEGLGDFMELEVVLQPGQTEAEGRAIADTLMQRLGVTPDDLVSGAYLDLLLAQVDQGDQGSQGATPPAAAVQAVDG